MSWNCATETGSGMNAWRSILSWLLLLVIILGEVGIVHSQTPAPTFAPTSDPCNACVAGKYYAEDGDGGGYQTGGYSCIDCPPGYYCLGGCSDATACSTGRYTSGGASSCNICDAGYYCPVTSMSYEVACSQGTYSYSGATTCTPCPAGYACTSTTSNAASACSSGSFSTGSQSSCTSCPAGYACSSTTSALMTPCSAGYYSLGGVDTCTICPAGSSCPSKASNPVECPAGTYSASGAVVCTPSPAGYYIGSAGSSTYAICAAGTYSTGGSTVCTDCSPGYLCATGSTSPTPLASACAIGGYCSSATLWVYTYCPKGTYGITAAGQSLSHACKYCEPGYYCPSEGLLKETRTICPAGAYCPMGSDLPSYCPGGYYSGLTQQQSIGTCTVCPAGTFCLNSGTVNPTSCPEHYYCPVGTADYMPTPCPAGTYSEIQGLYMSSQCNNCTEGHYCPGDTSPTPCPRGRYNQYMGIATYQDCQRCEPGYACPTTGMTEGTSVPCTAGYYCPSGTSSATEYACPAGRYSDATNLVSKEECTTTEAGYTSPAGSTSANKVACVAGHYCPAGTSYGNDIDCPAGTYSSTSNNDEVDDCAVCNEGYFCLGGGSAVSGDCPQGYYCPAGTGAPHTYPCPAGWYSYSTNLAAPLDCTDTPIGHYSVNASISPTKCPAGRYTSVNNTEYYEPATGASIVCEECTAGHYCPEGSSAPIECGTGYYSNSSAEVCAICPIGAYCASNTSTEHNILYDGGLWSASSDLAGVCFPGTLCATTGYNRAPDMSLDPCPAGYYCPAGTAYALPCPSGTYNALTGQDELADCTTTEAGYYSTAGLTAVAGLCLPGYYCPAGSTSNMMYPCLAGTYRAEYGGTASSDCATCTAGSYCPKASYTPLLCPRGYYCPAGTSEPEACTPGTYGNVAGLKQVEECIDCDPGYYCETYALQAPTGLCTAGYFCAGGTNTSTPQRGYGAGNWTSGICPQGYYCDQGSATPAACPAGYFNENEGGTSSAACTDCTPGQYCEGLANIYPTGFCSAGYYCTGTASTPTQYVTPAGYSTSTGATAASPCLSGTYQDHEGQSACVNCPAGYYCAYDAMTNYTSYPCPAGHYCEAASSFPANCPIGTFSGFLGNTNLEDCLNCTAGSYCDAEELTEPTGLCSAGYYCSGAAIAASAETTTETGGPCTAGHYCLEGTAEPVDCPAGTYMSTTHNTGTNIFLDTGGNTHNYTCTPCSNGNVCTTTALTAPDDTCDAGYWCNLGAATTTPDCVLTGCIYLYDVCPAHHYCPAGSSLPLGCAPGTYNAEEGQTTCGDCTAGYYCLGGGVAPIICPAGSYCPAATASATEHLCPLGTYSNKTGLIQESQCETCPAGYYCPILGSGETNGTCDAGYFCGGGSYTATPADSDGYHITYVGDTSVVANNASVNDVCPPGHYCPQGSVAPTPCPAGKYGFSKGQKTLTDCSDCPGGMYCPVHGMTNATRDCPGGYYCPTGSSDYSSNICPPGTYCPAGSASSILCAPGYYQNATGQLDCDPCPAGYYCPEGAVSTTICPIGTYCPVTVAAPITCANGTYTNSTGLLSQDECTICPTSYYCNAGAIQGLCAAGYFCKSNAPSATPDRNVSLPFYNESLIETMYYLKSLDYGQCPPNHYCVNGTTDPVQCDNGTVYQYTHASAKDNCGPCPAGTYCVSGAPTPELCPLGYYCPFGSVDPLPCPRETYGAQVGYSSAGECQTCPAGYSCNSTGIIDYTLWPCPAGYYCPNVTQTPTGCPGGTYLPTTGAAYASECIECPMYHYCPTGSSGIQSCPAGSYCDVGSSSATSCPPGTYCPQNSTVPTTCPARYYCPGGGDSPLSCYRGTYCPEGTDNPIMCPLGYILIEGTNNTISHLGDLDTACEMCAAGKYGNDVNREQCYDGTPGYVFYGGTTGPTPANVTSDRGEPCPAGYYCPANTSVPTACEVGKYNPSTTQTSSDACLVCPAGTYSYTTGSAACTKCSASATSASGASVCTCVGNNRAFQPTDGYCICIPGYEFVDADFTVSSEEDGSVDCQPIVYDRCASTETRDFNGNCQDTDSSCDGFCGSSGGKVSSTTGICECVSLTHIDDVCDATCRSTATTTACDSSGNIVVTYNNGNTETIAAADYLSDSGTIDCSTSGSKILNMDTSAGTFSGIFGAPASVTAQASRRRLLLETSSAYGFDLSYGNSTSGSGTPGSIGSSLYKGSNMTRKAYNEMVTAHRRLQDDASITNPTVCIDAGDSVIFSVTSTSYPVYMKDSLLNSNDDFDYSAFRDLAELAASTSDVSTFVFTFDEAGDYVFQISSSSTALTIISVVASGVTCGITTTYDTISASSLVTLGITKSDKIVLGPDWPLLIGLIFGMVGIVILIVGFLYYFRKKNWSYAQMQQAKYRQQASQGSEFGTSKGGTYNKNNKVVPTNFDEEKDGGDLADDVLKAMENQDRSDVTFDDDMLIPELAKHVQMQHDDVAFKLEKNQKQMDAMESLLKSEVDDLKALLQATALQMSSAGGSEAVKRKKLRQLLQEVKKDTQDRNGYSGSTQINESKFTNLIEGLRRLLEQGSLESASVIVEELVDSAIQAHDEENVTEDFVSALLKAITNDLEDIAFFYKENAKEIEEEKRRGQNADKAFENGLKTSGVAFPGHIRDMMTHAGEIMIDEDDRHMQVYRLLSTFAERIPRFTFAMESATGIFNRAAKEFIESGNKGGLDDLKISSKNEITSYLNDLIAALLLVEEKLDARVGEASASRNAAHTIRDALIEAIDVELGYLQDMPEGDLAKQLGPLLAKLKKGITSGDSTDEGETEGDDSSEDEDGVRIPKSTKKSTKLSRSRSNIDENLIDDVMDSEDLTLEQKEELLHKAQNDLLLVDQNLERQQRQKEELMNQVKEEMIYVRQDDEDDMDIMQNNKDAINELKQQMNANRDDKLAAMDRMEYIGNLDTDTSHDVRIATLAVNRYICALRVLSLDCRQQFFALEVDYNQNKCKAADKCLKKFGEAARAGANDHMQLSTECILEFDQAYADLDSAHEQKVQSLMSSVEEGFNKTMQFEDGLRAKWLKDPSSVNIDQEIIRLRSECNNEVGAIRDKAKGCSALWLQAINEMSDINEKILAMRRIVDHVPDKHYDKLLASAKEDTEISKATALEDMEAMDNTIAIQEYSLGHILNLCDSWGPKVNTKEHLNQLFERLVFDEQIRQDVISRLTLHEARERNEIEAARVESELNKRSASKAEVELVLQNLADGAKENLIILTTKLQQEGQEAVNSELDRQKNAVQDYEMERALAVQKECAGLAILKLRLPSSRRTLAKELRDALKAKQDNLYTAAQELAMSEVVTDLSKQQVHEEVLREDCELRADYSILEGESHVMMRLSAEVTSGIVPSTHWVEKDIAKYHTDEMVEARQALVHENARSIFKRKYENSKIKEMEQMRVMALGRSGEELDKIYSRLDEQLIEEMAAVDEDFNTEMTRLGQRIKDQQTEKHKVYETFNDEVYTIVSDRDNELNEIKTVYETKENECSNAPLADGEDEEKRAKAVIVIRQEFAEKIDATYREAENKTFDAFKEYRWKTHTLEKVEDDLNQLRNDLQQKKEATQNSMENEKYAKYMDLIKAQIAARNKARKLRDDYDMEVNGLDDVMKAKRDAQAKFLKDRLAKRRKKRLEELIKGGMSEEEAQAKVDEEAKSLEEGQQKQLNANLENETSALRKQVREEADELENDVMDKYRKALEMSEDGLAAAKKKHKDMLEARLKAKRDKRVRELMDTGMSEEDATKQAMQEMRGEAIAGNQEIEDSINAAKGDTDKALSDLTTNLEDVMKEGLHEKIAAIKADTSMSNDEKREAIRKAEDDFNKEMARIRDQEQHARAILENGLDEARSQGRKKLADRLAKKKNRRVNELVNNGMSQQDAVKQAQQELANETVGAEADFAKDMDIAKNMLKTAIEDNFKDKLCKIKCEHEAKLKGLDASLGFRQQQHSKNLKDRLARRKGLRSDQMSAHGKSVGEIKDELSAEFEKLEAGAEDNAIKDALMEASERDKVVKQRALNEIDANLNLEADANTVDQDAGIMSFLNENADRDKDARKSLDDQSRQQYDAAAKAAKSGTSQTDDELNKLRAEHEQAVSRLNADFENQKAMEENALKKKLAARKRRHKKDLEKQNEHKVDPNASPSEIKGAAEAISGEMEKSLKSELDDILQAIHDDDSLSDEQKRDAIAKAKEDYTAELERLKHQEEVADGVLQNGLENTHANERRRMMDKLAARKKARAQELRDAGVSEAQVAETVEKEASEELAKAERVLNEDVTAAKSLLDATSSPVLSSAEIDAKADADAKIDDELLHKQQDINQKIANEKAMAELNRKNQELEKMVIQREQKAAEDAANKANDAERDAQKKLEELRKQQDVETKKLEDAMKAERQSGNKNLKDRLAAKRAAKMKMLADKHASAEQLAVEEARLKQEEHEAEQEAEKRAAEEEQQRKRELQAQQQKAEEEAKKLLEAAEIEAQIAATKAAALDAVKESQQRAEEEINARELNRLKSYAEETAKTAAADLEAAATNKKLKLKDRLAAKREKRQKDMADAESKRIAELAATQAAEAEEREKLRLAKMEWSEHLAEAKAKAQSSGLSLREIEDFCINEVLGKKLVPPQHMSEAVSAILSDRHADEASKLVERNFDERIEALKKVSDKLLEEKNKARSDLLAQLNDEGLDDHTIAERTTEFDEAYSKKSLDEEKAATAVLDQEAMRRQMDLRQQHLQEVSQIIAVQSDPETLAELQKQTGKSAVEEMADYRAKLEREKLEREEQMKKAREEEEVRLKEEMENELIRMRQSLAAEQAEAEAEFTRKRQQMEKELAKQKEEMMKKQEDAENKVDKDAQARIRKEFDEMQETQIKALEEEKKKKKSKLAQRLANKRKKGGAPSAPTDAPPEGMIAAQEAATTPRKGEDGSQPEKETDTPKVKKGEEKWTESLNAVKGLKKKVKHKSDEEGGGISSTALATLQAKMDKIEDLLTNLKAGDLAAVSSKESSTPSAAPGSTVPSYIDESEPAPGDKLILIPDTDLHVQHRSRLDFGRKMAKMLQVQGITITAAASLPSPAGGGSNPFMKSYRYDHRGMVLAIHAHRLDSSGEFGMLIVHALSHIKVNGKDLSNDMDPAFLKEFYRNLQVLSQDVYRHSSNDMMRDATSSGSDAGMSGKGSMKGSRLLKLTGSLRGDQLADKVQNMDDVSEGNTDGYFSKDSLQERMRLYANEAGSNIPIEFMDKYSKDK